MQIRCRRPDRRSRARPSLLPVLSLLLGALGLFAPAPAEAQTVTLVTNFGQTKLTGTRFTGDNSLAQGFTTGSNSAGYTLASIEAISRGGGTAVQAATVRAELWSATTGGAPDSKIADLTIPTGAVAANATMSFGAPASTTLTASTTYYFVIYTVGAFNLALEGTSAHAEDSGGQSGWTIADAIRFQARSDTPSGASWATDSQGAIALIRVKGAAQQNTTDANLSALTASSHTSATGTFTALTLSPAFAADTTSYRAQVLNARTHLKLTPTVNNSSATVKVGKQGTTLATVTSGSASAAIALSVGSNAITVEVTAADGTTKKTYTVTVRRLASGQVWAARFTPATITVGTGGFGCLNKDQCDAQLTDNGFTVGGTDYHFTALFDANLGTGVTTPLQFRLNAAPNSALQALKLCIGTNEYTIGISFSQTFTTDPGLSTTPVSVSIGTSCAQQTQTQSTDATLSGLAATTSTSASGAFTSLNIGTFSSGTTSYTASVANSITHVKLTPTVAHSAATVTVAGTGVTSGTASGAIALTVGSNALSVVVTAEDGTTTRTYTVTITRAAAQSSNANLSALTATTSTSSTGTFTALTLTPSPFSAATTSYTATVANARTHAKVTPTVAHSSATVTVSGTAVTSGTASGAIALSVGSNAITVRVTAQDGTTTKDYTVTITRQAAASSNANLSGLAATTSTSSTGTFTALNIGTFASGTTSYTATVANARTHAKVTPTVAHGSATVTVNGTAVTSGSASAAIALTVGSNAITVRVTAQDGTTTKDYTVTITRQAPDAPPAVSLSASPNPVGEGSDVTVTATLSKALSAAVTIPLTLTAGTAEAGDYGALASITVASGATSGTGTITTSQDTDDEHETFTVALGSLPSSVTAGTPTSVEVRITDSGAVDATLTASPLRPAEGRTATLIARLSQPAPAGGITLHFWTTGGTASRGGDFTLEPAPPGNFVDRTADIVIAEGNRTAQGRVVIVADDEDEEDETIIMTVVGPWGSAPEITLTIPANAPSGPPLTLSASTRRPREGSQVTLTAVLRDPAPAGGVTVTFFAEGVGDSPATAELDYTLDPPHPSGAATVTADIVIPEGSRGTRATLSVLEDGEPEGDELIEIGVATTPSTYTSPVDTLTIPGNDTYAPEVWLGASPNPVGEGDTVTVTAFLSGALDAAVTVPVRTVRGTSESGDHGTLSSIRIAAGETAGDGRIATRQDSDGDDETFSVVLRALPASLRAGDPDSVEVTIEDDDEGPPAVRLEAYPNPVAEGDTVTVEARLSVGLDGAVTIPVRTVRGTSESGDHGTLSSIRIAAGQIVGEGRIWTARDSDSDAETFTVGLGSLPSSVSAGSPDEVEITISDDAAPSVWLEAYPNPVAEGDTVTVEAFLTETFDRAVTIPVRTARGSSESGDHGTLSGIRIAAGEASGEGRIWTAADVDGDDETFTVRLGGNLPSPLHAGSPDEVEITIADNGGGTAPGAPGNLRVTAGDERLDLTWTAPSSGSATDYTVEYKERTASDWTGLSEPDYTDTEAAIEGLVNGTRYDVRVQAWNEHGPGAWATGSGTPTGGGGSNASNANLRALTVRVSEGENGTYRSLALVPSFRQSVTTYATATAPAATTHMKLTPTAVNAKALILIEGHEVASGSASPAIAVGHGWTFWVTVISEDQSASKEYSVEVRIAQASGDAAGSFTAGLDAALAVVGRLSPEDAAGALLGERSLADERLEALDRLGNANGRYDVGDLLSWIERCKSGGARCGPPPQTPPPASDAALPGAVGAAATKRPRRRGPGGRVRRRTRPRRRLRGLAVLLAAALWSCDGGGVVDLPANADVPVPGTLAVEWTAAAGGAAAAGALVEIDGPDVGDARTPGGLELYAAGQANGPRRFVIAGDMPNGPVLEFEVPDRRQAGLYTVRVVEVAGEDHRLLDTDRYRAGIASN